MSSLDLSPVAAAEAQRLRERFGFLREVVEEMERSVPYASALVRFSDGQSIDLRDGEQSASRQDPHSGVVLTASNGQIANPRARSHASHGMPRRPPTWC